MKKICSKCGKTIEYNYIKPFKDYPELRLDENNVAVLCRVCNF